MRILIVEDDWTSREMLRVTLSRMGHDVTTAENGREAWDIHRADPFPFVITDWMMPELTGLELCRLIRDADTGGYTYIILLTAKTDRQSLLEAFDAGVDDFLRKPFDPAELLARIRCGERVVALEEELDGRIQELGVANDRMKRDLTAAARIQEALLPSSAPAVESVRCAWHLAPCDELAGDIFNIFALGEHHIAVYLLDVSGHGVAAALLSVTLSRILSGMPGESLLMRDNGAGTPSVVPPAEVLDRLNARFQIADSEAGQYFTIAYGVLDLRDHVFRYSRAGHPPLIKHSLQSPPSYLDYRGALPIGFVPDVRYEEFSVTLAPGDRIFLYSDGLVEAENGQRQQYGKDRLLEDVQHVRPLPLPEAVSELVSTCWTWQAGHPQDDMSLLAIEIAGPAAT